MEPADDRISPQLPPVPRVGPPRAITAASCMHACRPHASARTVPESRCRTLHANALLCNRDAARCRAQTGVGLVQGATWACDSLTASDQNPCHVCTRQLPPRPITYIPPPSPRRGLCGNQVLHFYCTHGLSTTLPSVAGFRESAHCSVAVLGEAVAGAPLCDIPPAEQRDNDRLRQSQRTAAPRRSPVGPCRRRGPPDCLLATAAHTPHSRGGLCCD